MSDGVRSLTDPEQGVLQQCVGSPIRWLCPGLHQAASRAATYSHTFLPKHVKRESFMGVSHFKITRIVASLTAYRSARPKVQQCCCPALLSENAGPLEDFKYRGHSVYGLDLLQLCAGFCWFHLTALSVCHLSLKGVILFSSGSALEF